MEFYELEDIKRSTEYILDEINKSMTALREYAGDVGLDASSTDMFLVDIKQKLYDYYSVFMTAYEQKKKSIDKEQQEV